jgi:hypothetical protein
MFASWYNLAMLAAESQQAMFLRVMRIRGGGSGARVETQRMISERMIAGGQATQSLMAGASPDSVIAAYRRKARQTCADYRKGNAVRFPMRTVTGGRGGIRTHETVARLPVFKTGAFNHSATLPWITLCPPDPPDASSVCCAR